MKINDTVSQNLQDFPQKRTQGRVELRFKYLYS